MLSLTDEMRESSGSEWYVVGGSKVVKKSQTSSLDSNGRHRAMSRSNLLPLSSLTGSSVQASKESVMWIPQKIYDRFLVYSGVESRNEGQIDRCLGKSRMAISECFACMNMKCRKI